MSKNNSNNFSRRSFVQTTLLGAAGLTILPSFKNFIPSDTINLGFIGLGRQAMYLLDGFLTIKSVKVLASADVYG
ncbi:MAG: gfo/Idh/MocA family oxidoreductase, partial [Bacteroidetes bacterium]